MFTQNTLLESRPTLETNNVWIENSYVGRGWHYADHTIITGVPRNDWQITLRSGVCVDVVPVGQAADYALRPYGFFDAFRGDVCSSEQSI